MNKTFKWLLPTLNAIVAVMYAILTVGYIVSGVVYLALFYALITAVWVALAYFWYRHLNKPRERWVK